MTAERGPLRPLLSGVLALYKAKLILQETDFLRPGGRRAIRLDASDFMDRSGPSMD